MTDALIVDVIAYREWARRLTAQAQWTRSSAVEPRVLFHVHDRWEDRCQIVPPIATFLVGWSDIIPAAEIPDRCYVLHPSMLPEYRGGSPIQHQIIDGLDAGGITIFRLERGRAVDGGPIIWQEALSLAGSLSNILTRITVQGARGVAVIVDQLARGNEPAEREQDEAAATYRRRRTPEMSEITRDDLTMLTARQLHDRIRALADPYPPAFIRGADGEPVYLMGSYL